MRIETIQYRLPSKIISDADILEKIREYSKDIYQGDLNDFLGMVSKLFDLCGSSEKRILAENETPIALMREAFHNALKATNWKPDDIDLVVYVGIGKGFIEPANSYMTAQALGIKKAECFDLVDACMSWTRAIYLIKNLFNNQQYQKVMVINAEFNHTLYGFPALLKFTNKSQIEHRFPAFTLGEATTVTFLSNDPVPSEWKFKFISRPDLADLCTITNPSFKLFYDLPTDRIGKDGSYNFTSYGNELHELGIPPVLEVFEGLETPSDAFSLLVTHASSSRAWRMIAERIHLLDRYFDIFPKTGNLVSASIPVALAMAVETGKLKRNDRVLGLLGSAGMSFCAFSFTY